MKTAFYLTLTVATLGLCSCDHQGNRGGDTSREPETGAAEPIDDGNAATSPAAASSTTGTGTGTAAGTGTAPNANP